MRNLDCVVEGSAGGQGNSAWADRGADATAWKRHLAIPSLEYHLGLIHVPSLEDVPLYAVNKSAALTSLRSAVDVAASASVIGVKPREKYFVSASPEEGLRLVRAFSALRDPVLRRLICEVLEVILGVQRGSSTRA